MGTLVLRARAARRAAVAAAAHLRRRQRAGGARRVHARRARWDVLFVIEEDELRRAPDVKHYRLAQQLRRTLVTMDRDYLDDRRFPPDEGGGVLVINAPDERQLSRARCRASIVSMFPRDTPGAAALPLERRKLHGSHTDWGREHRMIVLSGAEHRAARSDPRRQAPWSSTAGASSTSGPAPCRPAPRLRRCTATTSSPGSSTCTCTASSGVDSLMMEAPQSREMAARLPRFGVTAFCPTTVACAPAALRRVLDAGARRARRARRRVARASCRRTSKATSSTPTTRGAQPIGCLRSPRAALDRWAGGPGSGGRGRRRRRHGDVRRRRTFCARSSARPRMSAS